VAVNETVCPIPGELATMMFLPAVLPRVQVPAVAMPFSLVLVVGAEVVPPP
jgi:hypothetical protein